MWRRVWPKRLGRGRVVKSVRRRDGLRATIESLEPRIVLAGTSPPVAVDDVYVFGSGTRHQQYSGVDATEYIEAGSLWYSSTDGSDQNSLNSEWKAGPDAGFDPASGDEAGWTSTPQPAKFGFGDGNESTNVPQGHATYYFFRTFDVPDEIPSRLRLAIVRDDCAAVYINGREVYRTSTLNYNTDNGSYCTAPVATVDESSFFERVIGPWEVDLRESDNTIAVEVHQASPTSSDLGFDLKLQDANAGLLANDLFPGGAKQDLTVEVVDAGLAFLYGTLDVSPDGTVTFMPSSPHDGGFFNFTYRVVDNSLPDPQVSNVATVFVTVLIDELGPPVASDDVGILSFVTNEDTPLVIDATSGPSGPNGVGVLANDFVFNSEWGPTHLILVTEPTSGGSVVFDGSTGGFTYMPGRDFVGVDTFQYVLADVSALSNLATVEIVVTPVDDAPTAVDDRYEVDEGRTLNVALREPVVYLPRRATWAYLDQIENGLQSVPPVAAEDYPRDAAGRFWNDPQFDVESSDATIGAWKVGSGVFSGPLDGLSFDGETFLDGIDDAASPLGNNSVTTYLFRTTFDVADATGIDQLITETLADDGYVVYLNGVEIERYQLAVGPLTTQSFATANGDESAYVRRYANVAGMLATGTNTLAVEVHQFTNSSSDVGFDMSVTAFPGGGVIANDIDLEGDEIGDATRVPGSGPSNGSLVLNADGTFVYTPDAGFIGVDEFRYTVAAGGLVSASGAVTIAVSNASHSPLDLNRDGLVERGDLATLVANFGTAGGVSSGEVRSDINRDGRVGLADAMLLRNGLAPLSSSPAAAVVVRGRDASRLSPPAVDRCVDCGAELVAARRGRRLVAERGGTSRESEIAGSAFESTEFLSTANELQVSHRRRLGSRR